MNKKKLIKKIALPTGIIAAFFLLVLIVQAPIRKELYQVQLDEFNKYIVSFKEQNGAYLEEVAGKIKSLPVDPAIINKLQSDYKTDNQKSTQPKKYIWMSSMNGDFIFGAPVSVFQKLNYLYDENKLTDTANKLYHDRNKFLKNKLDRLDELNAELFQNNRPNDWWEGIGNYFSGTSSIFSTPVYDDKGKLIGELHLLVDDSVNSKKYQHNSGSEFLESFLPGFFQMLALLLLISILLLWFLLPTWVYIDAKDRNVKNSGVWALLTLISLFFGLIIYLIVRPDTLKSSFCTQCGGELNGTGAYCPHCGYDLSNTFCQQCQYPIKPEWQFCPNCRAETKSKEHIHTEELGTGSQEESKE